MNIMYKQDNIVIGNSENNQVSFDSEKIINGEIRCLTTGMSGSGKSYLTRTIIESLYAKKLGTIVVIDPEGEYKSLRKLFDFVILGVDKNTCDVLITKENANNLALKMLEHKINVIINLDYTDDENRQEIVSNYLNSIIDNSSPMICASAPLQIIIDEASRFASKGVNSPSNIKCVTSLKRIAQFGRMRNISTFYSTQRVTQLHKDISTECTTMIIGKCSNAIDIERTDKIIGSSNLKSLKNYEFLAYGKGFVNGNFDICIRFKSLTPKSEHGIMKGSLFSLPENETVIKWVELMK